MPYKQLKARVLTSFPGAPPDKNLVRTLRSSDQVEWHMQISNEVDQELERLASDRILRVATLLDPTAEQICGVPDCPENIYIRFAFPSFRTGEEAKLWGVVGDGVDVVHLRGPWLFPFDLVSPGRDGSEGARCSWIRGVED